MARDTGPKCRQCRREGMKLFLKGAKCSTEKCPFARRQFAPGQHGKARQKLSNYAQQLREKQKVKRIYGVLEKQFRIYFIKASKTKGVTGKTLLQLLERRLDNVVFHMRMATSRQEARQIVSHGFVYVNGHRVNIPSFSVKAGDVVELRLKQKNLKNVKDNIESSKERSSPSWLEVDLETLKAKVIRLPQREDIGLPVREQLIVELYSK